MEDDDPPSVRVMTLGMQNENLYLENLCLNSYGVAYGVESASWVEVCY